MEMILNDDDIIVGAKFENGTIQDYVDEQHTYGLIRIYDTTAHWFLFNEEDSDDVLQKLYSNIIKKEHYIEDNFGEKIVLFNKKGNISNETMVTKIDDYLNSDIY